MSKAVRTKVMLLKCRCMRVAGEDRRMRVAGVDGLTVCVTSVKDNFRVYLASFARLRGIREVVFCYAGGVHVVS